jgi:hypothetical protein
VFVDLPPIKVSSASTTFPRPPNGPADLAGFMDSRMRWHMNQADLYERPRMRESCKALMPFLLTAIKLVASSHLWNGICERSKIVPVRAVNLPRQPLHMNMPACVLPPILVTVAEPQSGQLTPSGQRSASMWAVALASSVKIGLVRSQVMGNPLGTGLLSYVPLAKLST